jgi:uncharacterized protein involved in tellurium resistance
VTALVPRVFGKAHESGGKKTPSIYIKTFGYFGGELVYLGVLGWESVDGVITLSVPEHPPGRIPAH